MGKGDLLLSSEIAGLMDTLLRTSHQPQTVQIANPAYDPVNKPDGIMYAEHSLFAQLTRDTPIPQAPF
ncbi:hypothetical protein DIPPA_29122 [Diplonema papillatum]|nr:hypothetical protein DIPPA_29122 [Diplonema papillatum]